MDGKKLFGIVAVALCLLAAPLALSPTGGVVGNEACAAGDSCAPEAGSLCSDGHSVLLDYRLD